MLSQPHLDWVCEMCEVISSTSSRNEKVLLLGQIKSVPEADVLMQKLVSIGLDWFRRFGVAWIPEAYGTSKPTGTPEDFFLLVAALESDGRNNAGMVMPVLNKYNPTTAKWLRRFLMKELRMGVSEKTANKVWPGVARTFECMLAEVCGDPESLSYPLLVEPKIDGVRAIIRLDKDKQMVISRGGQELFNCKQILDFVMDYAEPGVTLDGELFVKDLHTTLGVVRTSVNQADPVLVENLRFNCFDIMSNADWDTKDCRVPQMDRTMSIPLPTDTGSEADEPCRASALSFPDYDQPRTVNTPQELENAFNDAILMGYEGVMVKELGGLYSFKRSSAWKKFKPCDSDAFSISGYYEGYGRHAGRLGGFTVIVPGQAEHTSVGGGFSDALRDELWAKKEDCIGRQIVVKYKNYTPDGNLREPVFVAFKDEQRDTTAPSNLAADDSAV